MAMRFGLYDARGYDFPVEKRFDALWRNNVAPGVGDFTQPEEFAGATPAALRALSLLSVVDLLVGPLPGRSSSRSADPGLSVAYRAATGSCTTTPTRCRGCSSSTISTPSPASSAHWPPSPRLASTAAGWP